GGPFPCRSRCAWSTGSSAPRGCPARPSPAEGRAPAFRGELKRRGRAARIPAGVRGRRREDAGMTRLGTLQAAPPPRPAARAAGRLGAEAPQGDGGALEAIAARPPSGVADPARKWLREDPRELKPMLAFSPESLEQEVMGALASEPEAAQFVLGRMAAEPAQTDTLILKVIGVDAFWVDEPGVTAQLHRLAESSADPDLMLAYLDAERRIEAKRMRRVLTSRIAEARKAGDAKALAELAAADERW